MAVVLDPYAAIGIRWCCDSPGHVRAPDADLADERDSAAGPRSPR
jgi:hypothetical protein